MSVQFHEQTSNNPKTLEATYPDNATPSQRLDGVPVSVLLWVYVETVPGGTHTIWWFGVADQNCTMRGAA